MMASFFDAHVLGIMTEFSRNTIDTPSLPPSEKLRCIRAIEHMIKLAKTNVTLALPQVSLYLPGA